jgi:hypothetical protein
MASSTKDQPLAGMNDAFLALMRAQLKFGQDLFQAVTGVQPPAIGDTIEALRKAAPKPVCYVPPPCWMPLPLGDCVSFVNECGKACVKLVITNCDRVSRTIGVRSEGVEGIEVTPASIQLGPMARATVDVCFKVPEDATSGKRFEALIWVDGCRQHFLRWTITVGQAGLDSCHEISVSDCPDYRHHWYDHFYCPRPCPPGRSTQNG